MKELTDDQIDDIFEGLEHFAPIYMARAAIAADRALNVSVEQQRELPAAKLELSKLRSILNDQNSRLENQLASLREWRRVASQKIDQSDPAAVACFINEVVSASLMYNGGTGLSVDTVMAADKKGAG